jgi:hypothetical protein
VNNKKKKKCLKFKNNVARTVCRSSRMDHVRVEDVLARADFPFRQSACGQGHGNGHMGAFVSKDRYEGDRNPLGRMMFGSRLLKADSSTASRPSRAAAASEVRVPVRSINTFINHGTVIWNKCPELRSATTKDAACKAAARVAAKSPI